jgi:hypothetical protein
MSISTDNTVVLRGPEDWDGGFSQKKSGVEEQIWKMIDPQSNADIP